MCNFFGNPNWWNRRKYNGWLEGKWLAKKK